MKRLFSVHLLACFILALAACRHRHLTGAETHTVFDEVEPKNAGIDFENRVPYTETLNCYLFKNFYSGGGVAIADFNRDNLPDVFFCGNQVSNRLYLNKGNFQFDDITDKAGLRSDGSWTTGAAWADVNGDGLLDLYVCKSGPPDLPGRRNQLFIQQANGTFQDKAADYGVDILGLSAHAVFFDYDHDNDLDFYLLSNSLRSVGGYDLREGQREKRDPNGANKFFRNDGGVKFSDVSAEAGIYGSDIGFGLGVAVGDYNRDGWQDMFVSNDFFERDYLYLNQKNGTFKETGAEAIAEMSMGSMGADIADINNDLYPDIYVTEMLPFDYQRYKTKTQFDNWNKYLLMQQSGYHRQYSRNVLQLNEGTGTFQEVSRYAGVEATDWSWGALIADFDLDGWKDIFVANGVGKDLLDQDYIAFFSDKDAVRQKLEENNKGILGLIDQMPSAPIQNYLFKNTQKPTPQFQDISHESGFSKPTFSNGSAYADLDNDGDLDLVVNNLDAAPGLFRNNNRAGNHAITLTFRGEGANTFGLGAQVTIKHGKKQQFQELSPMRGFQSCADMRLTFGLGSDSLVQELECIFPVKTGFKSIKLNQIKAGQTIVLDAQDAQPYHFERIGQQTASFYRKETQSALAKWKHEQGYFGDFDREPLLFQMYSTVGPALAVADVNRDGLEDCFIGGGVGQEGAVFLQTDNGFVKSSQSCFTAHQASNDAAAQFFDADLDGDLDLYVGSGCDGKPPGHTSLADRLYLNDGKGRFSFKADAVPASKPFGTAWVQVTDVNTDGKPDLIVGMRAVNGRYGAKTGIFALINDGKGSFSPDLGRIQYDNTINRMTTDATMADMDADGDLDLVAVFDWGTPVIMLNSNGHFVESKSYGLEQYTGWWNTVHAIDLNADHRPDLLLGNHGLNSRFKASTDKPILLYLNDLDGNGTIDPIISRWFGHQTYPFAQRADLVKQVPLLKKDILKSEAFATKNLAEIESILPKLTGARDSLVANTLLSQVLMSKGQTEFEAHALSDQAQLAPIYAFFAIDDEKTMPKGKPLMMSAGSSEFSKPECGGSLAGRGVPISYDQINSTDVNRLLSMEGNIRHVATIKGKNKSWLIATRTNQTPLVFEINK